MQFEITDRYDALGIRPPAPGTCCQGECEGTGMVPVDSDDMSEPWRTLWLEAHSKAHGVTNTLRQMWRHKEWWLWKSLVLHPRCDGWHFVVCPRCGGTGKRKEAANAKP